MAISGDNGLEESRGQSPFDAPDVVAQHGWLRQRIGAPGQYTASPIAAGDQLILASVPGIVTVIQVDDELKDLARNDFKEAIFATPAVVENTIYLRTAGHLYALGE